MPTTTVTLSYSELLALYSLLTETCIDTGADTIKEHYKDDIAIQAAIDKLKLAWEIRK